MVGGRALETDQDRLTTLTFASSEPSAIHDSGILAARTGRPVAGLHRDLQCIILKDPIIALLDFLFLPLRIYIVLRSRRFG